MSILIVKLGALGDVLRTTPLLTALKKKYPASRVTWVVDKNNADVLTDNPLIDKLISYTPQTPARLSKEKPFELAINLDKEKEALDCVMMAPSKKKMGFGRDASGALAPLNPESDYAYRLGIDDELKFRTNKKTYQQISFEQVGLEFGGEEYLFSPGADAFCSIDTYFEGRQIDLLTLPRPIIGLNTGSGHRFAGKRLPVETFVELARFFHDRLKATVFLLGGRDEIERNRSIEVMSSRPVINTGSHSIREFAAIIKLCDAIISGDTTAMHIAIAMKVPVVSYFASTCAAEIELYGRGKKVISEIACAPCYKKICPIGEQCMKDMRAEELYAAVLQVLPKTIGV